jgi:hypothetical protein
MTSFLPGPLTISKRKEEEGGIPALAAFRD